MGQATSTFLSLGYLSSLKKTGRWVVGFSGGEDSLALVHALSAIKNRPPVIALHINHQLQSEACAMSAYCKQVSGQLSIPFIEQNVTVTGTGNIEEQARQARYQAFSAFLSKNDVLFLGHHQQDQAETLLYRLFRGAGFRGLGAIKPERSIGEATLVRPLLSTSKAKIQDYLAEYQLVAFEDPSNMDVRFDRNYIRLKLLPVIQSRWPAALKQLSQASLLVQQDNALLEGFLDELLQSCEQGNDGECWLSIECIRNQLEERKKPLVRHWLKKQGVQLSFKQLHILFTDLLEAAPDAQPVFQVGEAILRRFKDRLYLVATRNTDLPVEWNTRSPLFISGVGSLVLSNVCDYRFTIVYRSSLHKVKLAENRPHQSVKHLLHDLAIPPWRRDSIPFFFYDDRLVAVGHLLVTEYGRSLLKGVVLVEV